jgi:hypothetical protein
MMQWTLRWERQGFAPEVFDVTVAAPRWGDALADTWSCRISIPADGLVDMPIFGVTPLQAAVLGLGLVRSRLEHMAERGVLFDLETQQVMVPELFLAAAHR